MRHRGFAEILELTRHALHRSVYAPAIMERMAWTDNRLQDRFDSIDRRFDEVDRRFEQVDRRFDKVDAEIRALNVRFDALQRTMFQIGGGVIAALIAGFAGVIATQL